MLESPLSSLLRNLNVSAPSPMDSSCVCQPVNRSAGTDVGCSSNCRPLSSSREAKLWVASFSPSATCASALIDAECLVEKLDVLSREGNGAVRVRKATGQHPRRRVDGEHAGDDVRWAT